MMTLKECEAKAQNDGFDSATFDLVGPKGRIKCKWLDAYFGMFQPEGADGFMMVSQLDGHLVWAENFQSGK